MSDPLDFTGKVVLVTGSSRGIGAEMIKAFGAHGAQCVVNYVDDAQGQNKTDAANLAKELDEPLVIECDVTQPAQVEAMMKQIQDRHGGLDILVNNSGIIGDRTIFTVNVSESFTVPDSVPAPSPTSAYVPSGVAGTFQNNRPGVGGQLLFSQSDAAGPNNTSAFENEVFPGDVITLSAVVENSS